METADGYNLLYLTVDAADLTPALMPVVCHHHGLAQLVRAMGVSISFGCARLYPLRSPHELLPVEHNLALIPTLISVTVILPSIVA